MINRSSFIIAGGIMALCAGILFFVVEQRLIVVDVRFFRATTTPEEGEHERRATKKQVTLYAHKENKELSEKTAIVWRHDNQTENIKALANAWLTLLHAERIIDEKTIVETVGLSEEQKIAYVTFSLPWLKPQTSTIDKLLLVESLLKTIKNAVSGVSAVQLLVKHEAMKDVHLECDYPWPLDGWLSGQ